MIYEFITPSDPITFIANDDKIAIAVTIVLSNGKAACRNEKGESLNTMVAFSKDPLAEVEESLGEPFTQFVANNKEEMAKCFLSFAYGTIESRRSFDDAVSAITDENNLKEFKAKHEYRNRSSMSAWVKSAWNLGNSIISKLPDLNSSPNINTSKPENQNQTNDN